jgi:hypothetical protein
MHAMTRDRSELHALMPSANLIQSANQWLGTAITTGISALNARLTKTSLYLTVYLVSALNGRLPRADLKPGLDATSHLDIF